jgi:hypothetical protein
MLRLVLLCGVCAAAVRGQVLVLSGAVLLLLLHAACAGPAKLNRFTTSCYLQSRLSTTATDDIGTPATACCLVTESSPQTEQPSTHAAAAMYQDIYSVMVEGLDTQCHITAAVAHVGSLHSCCGPQLVKQLS